METKTTPSSVVPSETNVITLSERSVKGSWLRDITTHDKTLKVVRKLAKLRVQILQTLKTINPVDDVAAQADKCIRPLPNAVRARMALRLALSSVKTPKPERPTPKVLLIDELAYLTAQLKKKKAELKALEDSILTAHPKNAGEAQTLLRFVSGLVTAGHPLERRYLSVILEECAASMTSTSAKTAANMDTIRRHS